MQPAVFSSRGPVASAHGATWEWNCANIRPHTETAMFFEAAWSKASAILFLEGRLTFH